LPAQSKENQQIFAKDTAPIAWAFTSGAALGVLQRYAGGIVQRECKFSVAMTSLFTRLFKYTSRDGHSPLENFLTECLHCFLERLTAVDRKSLECFIAEVLCGSELPPALRARISCARSLTWTTQQPICCDGERGYLDICLRADNDITNFEKHWTSRYVVTEITVRISANRTSSDVDGTVNPYCA